MQLYSLKIRNTNALISYVLFPIIYTCDYWINIIMAYYKIYATRFLFWTLIGDFDTTDHPNSKIHDHLIRKILTFKILC
ncbi:hypothetical protein D3C87_217840 [compost metagenome]